LFVFLLISSPSDTYKPGDYIGKSDWWLKAWEFFLSFYFFAKNNRAATRLGISWVLRYSIRFGRNR
jgi:hypothetical protein